MPLVDYPRFTHDPALASHIVGLDQYYRDLAAGTLPAVATSASSAGDDERSARSIPAGQDLVREHDHAAHGEPYWDNSALMWSYDGSGGWYDSVRAARGPGRALGFRVPALLVSAYARRGQVNHTVLDYTSALQFIEQNWRLAPLAARDAHANSLASASTSRPAPPAVLLRTPAAEQSVARPAVPVTSPAQGR